MKRFFGITMAAVCALTMASFGFSACGSDSGGNTVSDEVDATTWISAMSGTNMYNVTVNSTANTSYNYHGSDGSSYVSSYSESTAIKLALTATETSGYTTGNTSISYSSSTKITDNDGSNESFTDSTSNLTLYEVFTEDSYSFVSYTNGTNWDGYHVDSQCKVGSSEAYQQANVLSGLVLLYNYFSYTDGAYKYTSTDEDETYIYVVKINSGRVTYYSQEYSYTYTDSGDTETYSAKYEYTYSNYGSTDVTVPESYTYEYYISGGNVEPNGNVTQSEWESALSAENLYNVTVNFSSTITDETTYTNGTNDTYVYSETGEIKLDFGVSGGIIDGYMSMDSEINDSLDGEYCYTRYDIFGQTWSYVENTYDETDSYMYGDLYEENTEGGGGWFFKDLVLYGCNTFELVSGFVGMEDYYWSAEYSDGIYTITDGNYTYQLKIENGYVTYLSVECTENYSGNGSTEVYTTKDEFYFSDYGTTSVTVPEEYTYEYYNANK